ncbi:type II toxin-antitoxin system PemK/MazF family toxin [Phormidesmis sp. 146-20]
MHYLSRRSSNLCHTGFDPSPRRRIYSEVDRIGDQVRVLSKSRLLRLRGTLSEEVMTQVDQALLIAFDLPGQSEDITE